MSDLNDRRASEPCELAGPQPERVDKTGTDLPVPLRGTGGSINGPCERCPFILLDAALAAVPVPPLNDVTWGAAYRWLAQVEAGLTLRRERRMLASAVERALSEEYRSRRHIESIRRSMERRSLYQTERAAGTHWQRRDAGRASKRPARVEVDPDAWERFKAKAAAAGTTAGERLGHLATEPSGTRSAAKPTTAARRTLFLRIAIEDDAWQHFAQSGDDEGTTAARRLGQLVEHDAR
ncbi:MAG: hypothetical protein AB7W59_22595 [Acidimicrobiia bacterium]